MTQYPGGGGAGLGKPVPQEQLDKWCALWRANPPFEFKTTPYIHQLEALVASARLSAFALFMEMGTGKSWIAIQHIAYLWTRRLIKQAVVIAPNGVHVQWAREQIPLHMPSSVRWRAFVWKQRLKEIDEFRTLGSGDQVLPVLCVNTEAFSTVRSAQRVAELIVPESVVILDESSRIKNTSARRTQLLCDLARQVAYRRILTGSPITRQIDDLYAQFNFLDPQILGLSSQHAFKARYCTTVQRTIWTQRIDPVSRELTRRKIKLDLVVGLKNLDDLRARVRRYVYRVTKAECLDLPDKIYMQHYVPLTDEQSDAYRSMLEDLRIQIQQRRIDLTATSVLTQLLRLQQVLGGWLPSEDGAQQIASNRATVLTELVEDLSGKIVIWANFVREIEELLELFGVAAVGLYGACSSEQRAASIQRFKEDSSVRFLIGNTQTGGLGLNLTVAATMIYYSHNWSLELRTQSEDRIHRIGQSHPCTYIDLVSPGTIDDRIRQALRRKQSLADLALDDLVDFVASLEDL